MPESGSMQALTDFWDALGAKQEYFETPTVLRSDPIFCIRTKPGFIFDDSFWEVFHAHPLIVCHVAYYGPERLEDGNRTEDTGIFEIRFVDERQRAVEPEGVEPPGSLDSGE